jgi:hypothetical protein
MVVAHDKKQAVGRKKENRMANNDREAKIGGRTLVAIVSVFILAFVFFT